MYRFYPAWFILLIGVGAAGFSGCSSSPAVPAGAPVTLAGPDSAPVNLSGATKQKDTGTVSPSAAVSGGGGTLLAVPSKDQLRKNMLDGSILGFLEQGSPDSLALAVERINADSRGMTDQSRIALAVAGEMMKMLYPLVPFDWPIPSVPESGVYIGAIHSAQLGVYDYNTGDSDFLSMVLPSLVLSISGMPGDYYGDAERTLLRAASMNPKSVLPPYFLALIAERQGKNAIADEYYKKTWDMDSSCYPAGIGYVRSQLRKSNGGAALEVGRILVTRFPENIPIVKLCAEASFQVNDWAAADPYVLKVLKAEPDNTAYLLMRARILIERKEYLKANSLLDAFATINRTDKNYLLLRSRVIREWTKNLLSATTVLQEAQRRYPDDIEVLLATAEVCYQTGQPINQLGGRDFVRQVLAKDGQNRTALALLVTDYLTAGEWQNAVKSGEQLVALASTDANRQLLIRAYMGAGQSARAVSLAKTLYAAPAPSDDLTALYLQSLVASGDTRTASAIIASRMGDASSTLKSQLYYYESRLAADPDSRLSSLRSCLLADPRNSQGLFAMYSWYFDKSDYRKAQYYLKQVIALDPLNKKYSTLLVKLDELLAR